MYRVVRDYVLLTLLWLFDCRPNSAWAEMADQFGNVEELQK